MTARLQIAWRTQCRWLLTAAWIARDVLTTFERELGEVAPVPGRGGIFDVPFDGQLIYSRAQAGRFPGSKSLKQLVRDRVAWDKPRGHSARA
jgi:selenoprotein W-related protein